MATEHEVLREKVLAARDLVAYQEGAIASRMVVFKKTGSITAFSFDEGEGLPEHSAPFDAVLMVIDGVADVLVAGVPYIVREGEMIILPANKPHAVSADHERFKMVLVMIRDPEGLEKTPGK
jgi:quercetin dioxygenase-like cupin family protein